MMMKVTFKLKIELYRTVTRTFRVFERERELGESLRVTVCTVTTGSDAVVVPVPVSRSSSDSS